MRAAMTVLLLLVFCNPFGVALADSTSAPTDTRLEDVLTEWDWTHEVKAGRIALESQTLTFCAGGRVREQIGDDTGIHDSYGSWKLERSSDGYVLTLSGEQLHYRGRFPLTYSEKERAFYLHAGPGDITWRYYAVRRSAPDPCRSADNDN